MIATECSKWAERLPSRVTAVQPSSLTMHAGLAEVQHRFDGEHHPLAKQPASTGLAEIRHLRLFVESTTDAVTYELADYRQPGSLGIALDRVRQVAEPARP